MTVTAAPPRQPAQHRPPEAPRLAPEPTHGRLGGVAVGQIVAVEVAAVAVLAVLDGPVWLLGVAGFLAVVLLVLSFGRRSGHWWYESLRLRRAFRRRVRRGAALPRDTAPDAAALARLTPKLTVVSVPDRRTRFGVGQDDGGFFVALEALPGQAGQRYVELALDQFAELLTNDSVPISTLQLVVHVVPAPTGVLDWRAPAAQSYLELLGNASVPAVQRAWVAGRLSPADARAAADVRGSGVEGVHRALAAVVGRLGKALQSRGVATQVLDTAELIAAVEAVAGVADAAVDGTVAGTEEWRGWRTAEAVHVCFALTDLPRQPLSDFIAQLSRQQLLSFTLSIGLSPRRDGTISVAGLLRVAAHPTAIDEVTRRIAEVCRGAGARLRRLDGQHGPAVYATAPTGGGPA